MEDLSRFDGKNGKRAYVAYKGKVFDVTDSYLWIEGDHFGEHTAGKDLTQQMAGAPHSDESMEKMNQVGVLI